MGNYGLPRPTSFEPRPPPLQNWAIHTIHHHHATAAAATDPPSSQSTRACGRGPDPARPPVRVRWRGVRRPNVERKIWRFEVGDEPVPAGRPSTRGRANDAAEVGGRTDDAAEVGEEPVGGGRPSTRGLADDAAEVGDEPDGEGRPNSLDYADDAAEVGDEPVGVGRPSTRDCAADAPEVGDEPVPREAAAEVGDEPEGEDRPYSRDYAGDAAEVGDDPVGEGRPPRTTAVAGGLGGATGKTTLLTEGARKQQQWPVTGAGGTGKTTLPTEGAGRAEVELRPTTAEGEDQSATAKGKGPPIATLVERRA